MRLLELVRGEDTADEVIDCLERFNESRMGKGIVVCNDTPVSSATGWVCSPSRQRYTRHSGLV